MHVHKTHLNSANYFEVDLYRDYILLELYRDYFALLVKLIDLVVVVMFDCKILLPL